MRALLWRKQGWDPLWVNVRLVGEKMDPTGGKRWIRVWILLGSGEPAGTTVEQRSTRRYRKNTPS